MEEIGISKGLFGFDKIQVNQYIADLKADYNVLISQKDSEIEKLKKENEELKESLKDYEENKEKIKQDKEAIACVLLKAQEQANCIVEQTRVEFEKEKVSLEDIVEKEREKLLDVKKDLGTLKLAVVNVLEKYAKELEKLENGTFTKVKKTKKEEISDEGEIKKSTKLKNK